MRSIEDIVDAVVVGLRADPRGVESRREKVRKLARLREEWSPPSPLLRSRKDAVFTLDQTRMMEMDRRFHVKLLVLGHHVADVIFDSASRKMKLEPLAEAVARYEIVAPTKPLSWSGQDGQVIREFIGRCANKLSGAPELQVQLQLVRLLCAPKKARALANLRPVMPFGFPTEIPTVVDRKGRPATGNMDILARTKRGRGRSAGEFVVLELKKPGLSANEVESAFEQAIGYAAALRYEANSAPDATVAYRQLYGPSRSSKSTKYDGLALEAHAVVVLPEQRRAQAEACLRTLGRHDQIQVGALFYQPKPNGQRWGLDETAFAWSGWSPTI